MHTSRDYQEAKLEAQTGAKMFLLCGTLLAEGQQSPAATSEQVFPVCARSFVPGVWGEELTIDSVQLSVLFLNY